MKRDSASVAVGFITGFAAIVPVALLAMGRLDSEWRDEAVKAGHAEYYLDADHNRQWRWKEVGDE